MWTNVFLLFSRNLRTNLRRQIAAYLSILREPLYDNVETVWQRKIRKTVIRLLFHFSRFYYTAKYGRRENRSWRINFRHVSIRQLDNFNFSKNKTTAWLS